MFGRIELLHVPEETPISFSQVIIVFHVFGAMLGYEVALKALQTN